MKKLSLTNSTKLNNGRLYFLDNIRTIVIILVVIHHIAIVYGAFMPFYYSEQPFNADLLVFCIVNQSWFIGIIFLLAGYFTPGSFTRKGPVHFLKDRLLRLGVPGIFFYFVLNPLSSLGIYAMPSYLTKITRGPSWQDYPALLGLGPLWFVVMLLIFSLGYLLVRIILGALKKQPIQGKKKSIPLPAFFLFPVALAAVSFFWRMIIPIGKPVWDFPTLGYFPQYLSFYCAGILLARYKGMELFSKKAGLVGFGVAIISFITLFPLAYSGSMFSMTLTPQFTNTMGNGHWQSAVYGVWDSIFAVSMSVGIIAAFRYYINKPWKVTMLLSRLNYTVYIIHIPLIVIITVLGKSITFPALVKTALAGIIIIPLCFITAYLIRKLPGIKKIL